MHFNDEISAKPTGHLLKFSAANSCAIICCCCCCFGDRILSFGCINQLMTYNWPHSGNDKVLARSSISNPRQILGFLRPQHSSTFPSHLQQMTVTAPLLTLVQAQELFVNVLPHSKPL